MMTVKCLHSRYSSYGFGVYLCEYENIYFRKLIERFNWSSSCVCVCVFSNSVCGEKKKQNDRVHCWESLSIIAAYAWPVGQVYLYKRLNRNVFQHLNMLTAECSCCNATTQPLANASKAKCAQMCKWWRRVGQNRSTARSTSDTNSIVNSVRCSGELSERLWDVG